MACPESFRKGKEKRKITGLLLTKRGKRIKDCKTRDLKINAVEFSKRTGRKGGVTDMEPSKSAEGTVYSHKCPGKLH